MSAPAKVWVPRWQVEWFVWVGYAGQTERRTKYFADTPEGKLAAKAYAKRLRKNPRATGIHCRAPIGRGNPPLARQP